MTKTNESPVMIMTVIVDRIERQRLSVPTRNRSFAKQTSNTLVDIIQKFKRVLVIKVPIGDADCLTNYVAALFDQHPIIRVEFLSTRMSMGPAWTKASFNLTFKRHRPKQKR